MNHHAQPITFLRPEHLTPLRSLSLVAKRVVEGMLAGFHKSPFHGFSCEFLEYRDYRFGEPVRTIDWRKYAKTDKTVVRLFEDETNCSARICIDNSASMAFKSGNNWSKFDFARALAASLAWILIRQHDAVGLCVFNADIDLALTPHAANIQLKNILSHLEAIQPRAKTHCAGVMKSIAMTIKKRGLCIIISDLFDDVQSIRTGLRYLTHKKQECIVLRIMDELEQTFSPGRAMLKVRDLETHEEMLIDGSVAAAFYSRHLATHHAAIQEVCSELSIDCIPIVTNEPFAKALIKVLEKRRSLH